MIIDTPTEYQVEAYKLDAQGLIDLFQINLLGAAGSLYFTPNVSINWQGKAWTGYPCGISDAGVKTSGEYNRPKMTLANPQGIFSSYVQKGVLDNAIVLRYRVLPGNISGNINSFVKNTWRVSKIISLNKDMIVLELRSAMDGHNFKMPGNSFFPPDYPHVSLG